MPFRPTSADPPLLESRHYLMLVALLAADSHGLAIAREVERLSEGRVHLWPATLYGSLDDLCARGFIKELVGERPRGESARKHFYRITAAGRAVARAETERLADLVKVARARVKPRGEIA
jgi:DNA-binding PadR family transcriptional regulator